MDKDITEQQKSLSKRKPRGHFKACICCGCFFHLAGGEPNKSLHERGEGKKQAHLWSPTSVLRSQSLHPPGEGVAKGERDKGRRERERKEEIVGEIYRPLQQLTEG